MVTDNVRQWINRIHELEKCPESIHELLDLIQGEMLQPKPDERSDSLFVRQELQGMYKQCRENEVYATKGYSERRLSKDTRVSFNAPQAGNAYPHSANHSDIFPELSDEMRIQAPLPQQLDGLFGSSPATMTKNPRRRQTNATSEHADAKAPKLPVHLTNGTSQSDELLQLITNDTTPYTTQPEDPEWDSQEDRSKRSGRGTNSISFEESAPEDDSPTAVPGSSNASGHFQHISSKTSALTRWKESFDGGVFAIASRNKKQTTDDRSELFHGPTRRRFRGIRDLLRRVSCKLRGRHKLRSGCKALLLRITKRPP